MQDRRPQNKTEFRHTTEMQDKRPDNQKLVQTCNTHARRYAQKVKGGCKNAMQETQQPRHSLDIQLTCKTRDPKPNKQRRHSTQMQDKRPNKTQMGQTLNIFTGQNIQRTKVSSDIQPTTEKQKKHTNQTNTQKRCRGFKRKNT